MRGIYEALQDTRPQRQKLMRVYIEQIPSNRRIILAGDHTAWSRPNAATLKERTYEHYTNGGLNNRPVTIGRRLFPQYCQRRCLGAIALH